MNLAYIDPMLTPSAITSDHVGLKAAFFGKLSLNASF